ncbi:MAG TPA: hypothetical protein VK484_09415 [Ferruginibacter sp.]|nr:hypothetical protein [Ferruginibacter sp.]
MPSTQLYEFSIPGFVSQRQWCVYIIVGTHQVTRYRNVYVGKVGDNRDGCNSIITRIGNHLSHNKVHSQLRNKIGNTADFDYKVHFATFGEYVESNKEFKDKINHLERQLNIIVQSKITGLIDIKLENPYKGKGYLSVFERQYRQTLVNQSEIDILTDMAGKALT